MSYERRGGGPKRYLCSWQTRAITRWTKGDTYTRPENLGHGFGHTGVNPTVRIGDS